jgi:hypothetical protein
LPSHSRHSLPSKKPVALQCWQGAGSLSLIQDPILLPSGLARFPATPRDRFPDSSHPNGRCGQGNDRGGDKLPGGLEKHITSDIGPLAKVKEDLTQAGITQIRLRLVLARGQGRQDRHHEDAERGEPAGPRRQGYPRMRRMGTFLLHRLSQPTTGLCPVAYVDQAFIKSRRSLSKSDLAYARSTADPTAWPSAISARSRLCSCSLHQSRKVERIP